MNANVSGILHNSTTAISRKGKPATITADVPSSKLVELLEEKELYAETETTIEIVKPIKTAMISTVQARTTRKRE